MNNLEHKALEDSIKNELEMQTQIFEQKKQEIINNSLKEKDKEIERLNNIINELDKLISIKIVREANEFDYDIDVNDMVEIKLKLQELKEGK